MNDTMNTELMLIIFDLSSREEDKTITAVEAATLAELRRQSGSESERLNAKGITFFRARVDWILECAAEYQKDIDLVKAGELMLKSLE
jgi:hypothetical protein